MGVIGQTGLRADDAPAPRGYVYYDSPRKAAAPATAVTPSTETSDRNLFKAYRPRTYGEALYFNTRPRQKLVSPVSTRARTAKAPMSPVSASAASVAPNTAYESYATGVRHPLVSYQVSGYPGTSYPVVNYGYAWDYYDYDYYGCGYSPIPCSPNYGCCPVPTGYCLLDGLAGLFGACCNACCAPFCTTYYVTPLCPPGGVVIGPPAGPPRTNGPPAPPAAHQPPPLPDEKPAPPRPMEEPEA
jgi:hypothetical protein